MGYVEVIELWNKQADEHKKWDGLSEEEKIEFAIRCERERSAAVARGMALSLREAGTYRGSVTSQAGCAALWCGKVASAIERGGSYEENMDKGHRRAA